MSESGIGRSERHGDDHRSMGTESRKAEHIRICLEEDVSGKRITAGFERYRFRHNAVPELDFKEISLQTTFLGKSLRAPFLISSMTGGTREAASINRVLASAAEKRGWAMGVGSVRAALERPETAFSFRVRELAPNIPLLANLGAVQLNYGYGVAECLRAVETIEADALVLHLNGLQEVFQPEGNTNFKGLLARIAAVCRELRVPVGVKEVGWGIGPEAAGRLAEAGVAFIDVAGAGGTSWSEVERRRQHDPLRRLAAEAFAGWGVPTAECVRTVRERLPAMPLVASGGLHSGVDAAKALALGADLAGFGRTLLAPAVDSPEQLERTLEQLELECRAAMFGIGAADLAQLKSGGHLAEIR